MVSGFKDSSGKFHPISQQKGVSRKSRSRVRYSNGAGSAQEIDAEVRNFGTKIRDRYNKYKLEQEEDFKRATAIRRKYGGKLITAYRLAQKQQIKDGRDLEKFIRRQIPDLPKDKSTNRFVVDLLRDFKKSLKQLEKKKRGKSEDEVKALQKDFEESLVETETLFHNQQLDQEKEFKKEEDKRDGEFKQKIKKQNEEAKQAREAEDEKIKKEKEAEKAEQEKKKAEADAKQAEESAKKAEQEAKQASDEEEKKKAEAQAKQAEDDAKRAEQESKQAQEDAKKAEQEAKQAEQEAQKEEKQAENFSQDVFDELKMEEKKISQPDFDFGFPEEIV